MNVLPGYTFTGPDDPITYAKLNLLGQPTVTIGTNEIVTAMIADYSVTPIKLSQQTGVGFLGKRTNALGNMEYVNLGDGSVTWPTVPGIAISSADPAGTEFTMGKGDLKRLRITYDGNLLDFTEYTYTRTGDTNQLWGSGRCLSTAGLFQFNLGDGTTGAISALSVYEDLADPSQRRVGIALGDSNNPLVTSSVGGFPQIPSCAGVPTGAPNKAGGIMVPMVVDTTNNRIYFYTAAATWKYAALT